MIEALSALTDRIAALPQAPAKRPDTFSPGESAEDVLASLEGTLEPGYLGVKLARPVTFKSKGRNAVVLQKGRHRFHNTEGELVVMPGRRADFAPDGAYVTDDSGMVEHIKGRPYFGVEYWIVGEEPDAVPEAGPILDLVAEAMMLTDVAALDALEHGEQGQHARPAVLEAIAAARRAIAKRQDGEL